jgi:hypothetical protein
VSTPGTLSSRGDTSSSIWIVYRARCRVAVSSPNRARQRCGRGAASIRNEGKRAEPSPHCRSPTRPTKMSTPGAGLVGMHERPICARATGAVAVIILAVSRMTDKVGCQVNHCVVTLRTGSTRLA